MNVYKYRGSSSETLTRDFDSVVRNCFWAPRADQLNDPSEAYIDDREFAKRLKALGAKDVEASYDNLLKMRHTVGVYSLSKTPLDELMWAYYAGGHSGFCIEYDLDRLTLEARAAWNVIDVSYHPKPQTIIFEDVFQAKDEASIIGKMIGTKSRRWAHEEEIRIIAAMSGQNNYAASALTGIYFGCRCDPKFIRKFRQKLNGRKIKYYKMEFEVDTYQMTPRELQYDVEVDGARIEHLAEIEDGAISDLKYINDQNRPYYDCLKKAAEIVRRDTSCEKITYVDFSTSKTQGGKPVVYVEYETNVTTEFCNILNQYFPVEELEICNTAKNI